MNFGFTRSWFQTPNSFDAQNATAWSGLVVDNGGLGPNGQVVGPQDQRSKIRTFNIAPTWTRLVSTDYLVHLRRVCTAGSIQLLSQRQSVRRSHARWSSGRDRRPGSQADESRAPRQRFVHQRDSQHKGGDHVRGHDSHRSRHVSGSSIPRSMHVCLDANRKSRHGSHPDKPQQVHGRAAAESGFLTAAGVLRLDQNGEAARLRRLPEFDQRPVHVQWSRRYPPGSRSFFRTQLR